MANNVVACPCALCTMTNKKFESQSRHICATLFRWEGSPADISFDEDDVRYAVWQLEKCEKTGKEHLQMYIEGTHPFRLPRWKSILGENTAHIEVRRGSRDQARAYCMKEETRVDGPWEFGEWQSGGQGKRNDIHASIRVALSRIDEVGIEQFEEEDPVTFLLHQRVLETYVQRKKSKETRKRKAEFFLENGLLPWQRRVDEEIEKQLENGDDRKIVWVWEPVGNVGKSKFMQYLRLQRHAVNLSGKVDAGKLVYNGEPIVCFDLSRTKQEFADHLYSFAEELKNGEFLSSKYASTFKDFDSPVVCFFANFPPPEGKWSADRVVEFALHHTEEAIREYHVVV